MGEWVNQNGYLGKWKLGVSGSFWNSDMHFRFNYNNKLFKG